MAHKYIGLCNAYHRVPFCSRLNFLFSSWRNPNLEYSALPQIALRNFHDGEDIRRRSRQRQMKPIRVRVGKNVVEKCKRTPFFTPQIQETMSLPAEPDKTAKEIPLGKMPLKPPDESSITAAPKVEEDSKPPPVGKVPLKAPHESPIVAEPKLVEDFMPPPVPTSPSAAKPTKPHPTVKISKQKSETQSSKEQKESESVAKAADVETAKKTENRIETKPKADATPSISFKKFTAMLKSKPKDAEIKTIRELKRSSNKTTEMKAKKQAENKSTNETEPAATNKAAEANTSKQVQEETEAVSPKTTAENEMKLNQAVSVQENQLDNRERAVDEAQEIKTEGEMDDESVEKTEPTSERVSEDNNPNQVVDAKLVSYDAAQEDGEVKSRRNWIIDDSAVNEENDVKIKYLEKSESPSCENDEKFADSKKRVVIEVKREVYDSLLTTECVNKVFDNVENCEYEIYQEKSEPTVSMVEMEVKAKRENESSDSKEALIIELNENGNTILGKENIKELLSETTNTQVDAIGSAQMDYFEYNDNQSPYTINANTINSLSTTNVSTEKVKDFDKIEHPDHASKHPIYTEYFPTPKLPETRKRPLSSTDDDILLYSSKQETPIEPGHKDYVPTNEADIYSVDIYELQKSTSKKNQLSTSHISDDPTMMTNTNVSPSQLQDGDRQLNVVLKDTKKQPEDVIEKQSLAQYLYEKIMGIRSKNKEKHQTASSSQGSKREYATFSQCAKNVLYNGMPGINYDQHRKVTNQTDYVYISPDLVRQGLGAKAILNERNTEAQDFSTMSVKSTTASDTKSLLAVSPSSSSAKRESYKSFSMMSIEALPQQHANTDLAIERPEERCVLLLPSTLDEPMDVEPAVEAPKPTPPSDLVREIKILGGTKATPKNRPIVNFLCDDKSSKSGEGIEIKGGSKRCENKSKSTRKSSKENEKGASDRDGKNNFGTLMPDFVRTLWIQPQQLPRHPSSSCNRI